MSLSSAHEARSSGHFETTNERASGPRAGFWSRFVAGFVDGLPFLLICWGASALGLGLRTVAFQATFGLVALGYYAYFEGRPSGQTIGKRVMGIRVMDLETGAPLGFGRAAVRYVARAVSCLPFTLGYLWMLWDAERQTWHDKLSDSVVVPVADYPIDMDGGVGGTGIEPVTSSV